MRRNLTGYHAYFSRFGFVLLQRRGVYIRPPLGAHGSNTLQRRS